MRLRTGKTNATRPLLPRLACALTFAGCLTLADVAVATITRFQGLREPASRQPGVDDDGWMDSPAALITERAPPVVEAIIHGQEVREPGIGIVTIVSSEPIS